MKHVFYVIVTSSIFSAFALSSNAQTATGSTSTPRPVPSKASLKFIESVEITRTPMSNTIAVPDDIIEGKNLTGDQPSIVKNGIQSNIEHCSPVQFKYAMLIETEVEKITNIKLYEFINKWWATPYKFGGDDSNGIDCSAFAGKLLSAVYGLNVPRTVSDQYKICEQLATKNLAEGDLVFFNTGGGINHVGLYLGNNYFVHSSVHDGVTISSLNDQYYSSKFVAGGRIAAMSTPLAEGSVKNSR